MRVASLPEEVKPVSVLKHRPSARAGLSGVRGDSARRQNNWELGRPGIAVLLARQEQPMGRIHNPQRCSVVESERPIVAAKSRLQSGWSQGALVKVTLSQKPLE